MDFQYFEKISSAIQEGIIILNRNFSIVYGNKNIQQWLEIESFFEKNLFDFLDVEGKKLFQKNSLEQLCLEKSSFALQFKSSENKQISVYFEGAIQDEEYYILVFSDTHIEQTQKIIYTKLIQHMQEAVCITDASGKAVYANPRMCHLLGRNFDEIVWFSTHIWLDKASQKKVTAIDTNERKKWISSSYSITIVTKLWNHIPVSLAGTPLPDGGTIGIMTDLREVKEREHKEKVLYNALQFSTEGIIMCDTESKIHFWNKGAQLIFGKKYDDVIGKSLEKFFGEKNTQFLLESKEWITKSEIQIKISSEDEKSLSITQTPIFDESGNMLISYLLICRDITNYRKIESQLTLQNQKIKEAYQHLGKIKRQQDYIFEFLDFAKQYRHNLEKVAHYIVSSVIMLSQVDACEIMQVNHKENKLVSLAHFGFWNDWNGRNSIEYEGSQTQDAYRQKRSLKYMDIFLEANYSNKTIARKLGFTALMIIPLSNTKECIGSIALYTKSETKLEIFENDFIEKYAKVVELALSSMG